VRGLGVNTVKVSSESVSRLPRAATPRKRDIGVPVHD
jgi:hypothetical protein